MVYAKKVYAMIFQAESVILVSIYTGGHHFCYLFCGEALVVFLKKETYIMAQIFRLTGRQIGYQFLKNEKSGLLNFVRPVTLKPQPFRPQPKDGYDEHNMKLGRPLSPHLSIYDPQLTSILSITHRITGVILTGYAVALGAGAVVLPGSIPHYIDCLQGMNLGGATIGILKFLLAFPMTYHFWAGARHLIWDTGKFLTIKEVYTTGYIMVGLSLVSAIILSAM